MLSANCQGIKTQDCNGGVTMGVPENVIQPTATLAGGGGGPAHGVVVGMNGSSSSTQSPREFHRKRDEDTNVNPPCTKRRQKITTTSNNNNNNNRSQPVGSSTSSTTSFSLPPTPKQIPAWMWTFIAKLLGIRRRHSKDMLIVGRILHLLTYASAISKIFNQYSNPR